MTAGLELLNASAQATTYHVAKSTGSDDNDGSEKAPFATISACAAIAAAGDTCTVHAGTYRETVSPPKGGTAAQPIVFRAADGECAVVSGADPVSAGFSVVSESIWVAEIADPVEQLFSNGTMLWEAQWPNRTPGVLFELPKGVAAQGTGVRTAADAGAIANDAGAIANDAGASASASASYLVDPNIPPGDWTGALVYILPGSRWQSDSRPVLAYDEASHTITFDTSVPWAEKSVQPVASNRYYLYGSMLALDTQDEWVQRDGKLYYYSSDDPRGHRLEYKKRLYAFDIAKPYVQIIGFHVFGAAVRLTGGHDTVDSLTIEYPTHLRSFNAYYTEGDVNRIDGDDNVWKNSFIQKSGSAGLLIAGRRNRVENNIVRDVVYQATNQAGIGSNKSDGQYEGNVIQRNTVSRSGRAGIFAYGLRKSHVLYNRVSDWALLTNDMGGIYAWGTHGDGTEIAYNDVGGTTAFWSNGIYLDDKSDQFVVHHNHIHDSAYFGLCIKARNDYFNNTIAHVGTPFLIAKDFQLDQWLDTDQAKVENNLTDGTLLVRVGVLPTVVTDYGYFEAPVHATSAWQHVEVPFSSLYQPGWFAQTPLDLASVHQLAFTPSTNGDFEFDLDNVELLGPNPLLLDGFETKGGANALGGYPWGGGSGDGVVSTSGTLTYQDGGPDGSGTFARFAGTAVAGDDSWGLMTESLPDVDLSRFTGLAFDLRGRMKGCRVLAPAAASPIQDHNASCEFEGKDVPGCAVDQGVEISNITTSHRGSAPDLGAFESGETAWSAGAERADDPSLCGKLADLSEAAGAAGSAGSAGLAGAGGAAGAARSDDASGAAGTGRPGGASGSSGRAGASGSAGAAGAGQGPDTSGASGSAGGQQADRTASGCSCRIATPSGGGRPSTALVVCGALALSLGRRRKR